jgi:hypothetical protein
MWIDLKVHHERFSLFLGNLNNPTDYAKLIRLLDFFDTAAAKAAYAD